MTREQWRAALGADPRFAAARARVAAARPPMAAAQITALRPILAAARTKNAAPARQQGPRTPAVTRTAAPERSN